MKREMLTGRSSGALSIPNFRLLQTGYSYGVLIEMQIGFS